jgi:Rrf2 family protein
MLSSRATYATRALLDLCLRTDHEPVLIQEIADRQNRPLKYLQQILVALKTAGFVQSRKGPGGGYFLNRAPEQITLGAVVRAMDGPIAPISCGNDPSNPDCGCPRPGTCALAESFREARDTMARALDGVNFAQLRDRQKSTDERLTGIVDFVI